MARGGRRPGAGRKKGIKPAFGKGIVLGMDGARRAAGLELPAPPVVPVVDVDGLREPPAFLKLSDADIVIWRALAPHALAERTLTPSRVPGFGKLCQEWVYCAAFEARIAEIGVTTAEADRLLKRLNDYKKLLKASLQAYNITSFGKPATADKPKPAANPFAAFGT